MPAPRRFPRPAVGPALATALVATAVLAGCAPTSTGVGREASSSSSPTGAAYEVVPEPGRTIAATPPPGAGASSLTGYRIAVVVPADPAAADALLEGTRGFADRTGADVVEFVASAPGGVDAALVGALDAGADLVVGLGETIVDVFSFETALWPGQQFLLVGAQIPEPTENVTAVIWEGATSRGSAASADGPLDDSAITAARAADALTVGVDSVRAHTTGVVLALPPSVAAG